MPSRYQESKPARYGSRPGRKGRDAGTALRHGGLHHPYPVDAGAQQEGRKIECNHARQVGRQAQDVAPLLLPLAALPDGPGAVGDEGPYVRPRTQQQFTGR
jgi:hypothetical protein